MYLYVYIHAYKYQKDKTGGMVNTVYNRLGGPY